MQVSAKCGQSPLTLPLCQKYKERFKGGGIGNEKARKVALSGLLAENSGKELADQLARGSSSG
jgi:uncharacterized protein YlaN (UPF0358 family)